MARLKSQTLGVINGKIGNIVYRQVNGKTFASIRPTKYNVTNTEKSVKVKNGFKNLVRFSAFVNSIPILKAIWSNKKIQRGKRTYNKIFSQNKGYIKSEKITKYFTIVPEGSNGNLYVSNLTVKNNKCNFVLNYRGDLETIFDYNFVIVIIIYNSKLDQYTYQSNEIILEEKLNQHYVSLDLTDECSKYFSTDEESILFYTVVQLDGEDRIINWSYSFGFVQIEE